MFSKISYRKHAASLYNGRLGFNLTQTNVYIYICKNFHSLFRKLSFSWRAIDDNLQIKQMRWKLQISWGTVSWNKYRLTSYKYNLPDSVRP